MNLVVTVLGGLGVFLLGMIIMTDGLKSLAGDTMRALIMRFTRNAATGAVTGAITTAVLQSSSATTVAAVGFVGAGLLSFSESLGIIFGANIGTTITGWLVVLVGFKLNLSDIMLPVIFIGVMLRLFGSKKLTAIGLAIAGFGLIFVGIAVMQEAMASLQDIITPEIFPEDTIAGRLQLVLLGVLITIITQSSSAGVAMALTALFAGAINFEQAAAMVIGMDVGTTSTAAMATIGGNVSARRTGLSHVFYNLLTGIGAFLLLTPYMDLWGHISAGSLNANAEIGLVAFHSSFNTLGVMVVLPFTHRFARLIQRVIPQRESVYTAGLDSSLLKDNSMAMTALSASVKLEVFALFSHLEMLLGDSKHGRRADLKELQQVLETTQEFAESIHIVDDTVTARADLLSLIHVLDHMQRLHERIEADMDRAETLNRFSALDEMRAELNRILSDVIDQQELQITEDWVKRIQVFVTDITHKAVELRDDTIADIAAGHVTVADGDRQLKAIRWLRRVSSHVEKIMFYLKTVSH